MTGPGMTTPGMTSPGMAGPGMTSPGMAGPGMTSPAMTGPATAPDLAPEAYAAALADLPGMAPARLVALLRRQSPQSVWQQVLGGEVRRPDPSPGRSRTGPRATWADVAARRDLGRRWTSMRDAGIHVAFLGGVGFPELLANDPEPPGVVFWRGDLGVLDRPRVAIVGTRQCSGYGRSVAAELGRDLAGCGVCVVSGLALGIDGAAHQGALAAADGAGPLGVAASGVDTPYPRRHGELWSRVVNAGAVISEAAPRQPAQTWRFPARNRLIAGLSEAVVVVESQPSGGSMLTVAAAADRGIDVLAVPGAVTSPTSAGTNQLLHEGAAPVRHAGDVLAALGDLRPWPPKTATATQKGSHSPGTKKFSTAGDATAPRGEPLPAPGHTPPTGIGHLDGHATRVLNCIDRTPTATATVIERTGLPLGALSVILLQLEALGLVQAEGTWWERCDR
jgi:DNA processing protein